MPQQAYRANIRNASFPLVAENFSQSVMVGGLEVSGDLPEIYYCHNALPTKIGMQTIGYNKVTEAVTAVEDQFTEVFTLRDANENKAFFSHTSDGRNFVSLDPFYSWINTTYISAASASTIVTTIAHVGGETYIYFSGVGCYKYDFTSNTLVAVTLTSLTAANILGITAAYGYLIAYTATAVAWSSTIDPTDFTPSDITGAGSSNIQAAAGKIVTCLESELGFTIFTTKNALHANYSGNSAYPFSVPQAPSSGGIASKKLVSYQSNASTTFAYTTNGLQAFGNSEFNTILGEITDFVAGAYFEDFDESTLTFSREQLDSTMQKQLALISDRYLIISYGKTSLTHAIVVDLALNRFGKLRINHVNCFEWSTLTPEVIETPKKSIAFLQADGSVHLVDFDVADEYTNGVIIIGKFQAIRARKLHLHTIAVESVRVVNNFYAYHMGEQQAKEDVAVSSLTNILTSGRTRTYGVNKLGLNHSIILKGAIDLSILRLTFTVNGTLRK